MIDIHNHILPNVDDGSRSFEESIDMAKIAFNQGIKIMFATSHVTSRSELQNSLEFPNIMKEVQAMIDLNEIDLKLVQGAEVYPSSDVPQYLRDGFPLTLGSSKYILIDSPLSQMPMGLEDMVFDLQAMGYYPILAHPERVSPIQQNPAILESMVMRGLLLQMNASSLTPRNKSIYETAKTLLKLNWISFVASDAHSARHRSPMLGPAYRHLKDHIDEEKALELVETNGNHVLNNEKIEPDPLTYKSIKKSWFSLLFNRT